MQFTGERMVPSAKGRDELFFEHVVRYAFAARHVAGRRALDAGCGCGYGAHYLLRADASEVIGVDLDPASIDYSRRHFADEALGFAVGDVLNLPFEAESFDVVTCFEVFEHVEPPAALLAELRRVLRPDGVLVVSTPNALTYTADTEDGSNPFHVREYTPVELKAMIAESFESAEFFVQNPFGGIGIFPMDRARGAAGDVEMQVLSPPTESLWGEPREIHAAAQKSAYLIAECGVSSSSPAGKLFAMASDLADTTAERRATDAYVEELTEQYDLLKDEQATSRRWIEGVKGELAVATDEIERLRSEHASLEKTYGEQRPWLLELQDQLKAAEQGREELETYLDAVKAELHEATEGRRRLEAYVEEVEGQRQLEREAKERAEALLADKESEHVESKAWAERIDAERRALLASLDETKGWTGELQRQLDDAGAELDKVRVAFAELESAEVDRTAWASGLTEEHAKLVAEVSTLRAEIEKKSAHGRELEAWALQLTEQLEAKAQDGNWRQRLEEELRLKSERLETVEEAHRALTEGHAEATSWARSLERDLKETREGMAGLEESYGTLEKRHAELSSEGAEGEQGRVGGADFARLETGYAELEGSYSRLESGYKTLQEDHSGLEASYRDLEAHHRDSQETIKGLEAELAQAKKDLEGLRSSEAEYASSDKERAAWARSLEEELVASKAELERIRVAHEELARFDEQRASWARSLEQQLRDIGAEAGSEEPADLGSSGTSTPVGG